MSWFLKLTLVFQTHIPVIVNHVATLCDADVAHGFTFCFFLLFLSADCGRERLASRNATLLLADNTVGHNKN